MATSENKDIKELTIAELENMTLKEIYNYERIIFSGNSSTSK